MITSYICIIKDDRMMRYDGDEGWELKEPVTTSCQVLVWYGISIVWARLSFPYFLFWAGLNFLILDQAHFWCEKMCPTPISALKMCILCFARKSSQNFSTPNDAYCCLLALWHCCTTAVTAVLLRRTAVPGTVWNSSRLQHLALFLTGSRLRSPINILFVRTISSELGNCWTGNRAPLRVSIGLTKMRWTFWFAFSNDVPASTASRRATVQGDDVSVETWQRRFASGRIPYLRMIL